MTGRTKIAIAGLVAALMLSAAPAAQAVGLIRYASPGGSMTGDCSSPDPMDPTNPPCQVERAVETVALAGEEVVVFSGDHNLVAGSLSIAKSIDVHGADGQAMPQIISSASTAVLVNHQGASVRRLGIQHSGTDVGISGSAYAVLEQLIVRSTTGVNSACDLSNDPDPLRDSVCINAAANGAGVRAFAVAGTLMTNIRNVTAVATGAGSLGISVVAFNAGVTQALSAKNVIAEGVTADAGASTGNATGSATLTLSNSNYATESEVGPGMESVSDPGSATNQMAPPLFANAAMGDFHQITGSPTINAGAGTPGVDLMGTLDIDGEARVQGAAPDIGADEFEPPATPTVINPTPTPLTPATPKRKCKKGRKLVKRKGKRRCVKKKRKKRAS